MGGIFRTTREFVVDHGQNTIDILQNIIVPEPKHPIAVLSEIPTPGGVRVGTIRKHVLTAIDFNNDASIVARKIRIKRTNWRLPTEMHVWKRMSQTPPQFPFCIRHRPAKTARA